MQKKSPAKTVAAAAAKPAAPAKTLAPAAAVKSVAAARSQPAVETPAKPLAKSVGGARPSMATARSEKPAPSRDEIARRAYEIYLSRGQTGGRELEDWAQAERELSTGMHRNN